MENPILSAVLLYVVIAFIAWLTLGIAGFRPIGRLVLAIGWLPLLLLGLLRVIVGLFSGE